MTKVDLKKLEQYRARHGSFEVLDVPEARYLAVDGRGDPNTSSAFREAVETLFPVAYALKFRSARELGRDYVVPPLEGLWWAEDHAVFTTARDPEAWLWTLLVLVPDWVADELVTATVAEVAAKKAPPHVAALRLERLAEGRCVQTLHLGPFSEEGPVLARLHEEFLPAHGLRPSGKHHEVYLSDLRRTAPERLRTILRQPVAPA